MSEHEIQRAVDRTAWRQGAASWHDMLSAWANLVEAISEGYGATLYEYIDEMSSRGAMQAVLDDIGDGHPDLRADVQEIDDKFIRVTRPISRALTAGSSAHFLGWWWHRVPLRPQGELEVDLRAEGLLDAT